MNVLMITPYPLQPGKVVGGVEAVAAALATHLAAHESIAKLTILCFHSGRVVTPLLEVSGKLQVRYVRSQTRLALPTRSLLNVLSARRIAAQLAPDVVHAQGIGSMGDIATQTSRAAVVTVHGLVHVEARMASRGTWPDRLRVGLTQAMVRDVLRRASVVISTSPYDLRELGGLTSGKSVSICNPVAPEFFAESGASHEPRVLFAGMLVPRKNVEGLVRAFAEVRGSCENARLTIVGPSPDFVYAERIRDALEAARLGDAVDWLGHVEQGVLLRELRRCRALVLFSNEETSPTIIAQAMAAGRPVVSTRVGGIPDMVLEGETGFLVGPGDEQALAERLLLLLKSPELASRMGARARELALSRFEPSVVACQTVQAYRLAIREKHGS
jgi:glycosyltransferase involved in cell wall biosynthesis